MTVYLIHFTQPYRHARHYLGYTNDLPRRICEHQSERLHLFGAVNAAKIPWLVAKVWPEGDRALERRLKSWSGSAQFCPIYRAEAGKESTAILPVATDIKLSPAGRTARIDQAVPQAGDFIPACSRVS